MISLLKDLGPQRWEAGFVQDRGWKRHSANRYDNFRVGFLCAILLFVFRGWVRLFPGVPYVLFYIIYIRVWLHNLMRNMIDLTAVSRSGFLFTTQRTNCNGVTRPIFPQYKRRLKIRQSMFPSKAHRWTDSEALKLWKVQSGSWKKFAAHLMQ